MIKNSHPSTNTNGYGTITIDPEGIFKVFEITIGNLQVEYSNPNDRFQIDCTYKPVLMSYCFSLQSKLHDVKHFAKEIVHNPCIDGLEYLQSVTATVSVIETTLSNFHDTLIKEEHLPNGHSVKLHIGNDLPSEDTQKTKWSMEILKEEIENNPNLESGVKELYHHSVDLFSKPMQHYIALLKIPINSIHYILDQAKEQIQTIKSNPNTALQCLKDKYCLFKKNVSKDGEHMLLKGYTNKNYTTLSEDHDKLKSQLANNAICSKCYDPSTFDFTEAGAREIYKAENTTEVNLKESFGLVYQYEYVSEQLKQGFAVSLNIDLQNDLTFLPAPEQTDDGCIKFAKYIKNIYTNNDQIPLSANQLTIHLAIYYVTELGFEEFPKLVHGAKTTFLNFIKKIGVKTSINDTSHIGKTLESLYGKNKVQILQLLPATIKANGK